MACGNFTVKFSIFLAQCTLAHGSTGADNEEKAKGKRYARRGRSELLL